jgi:hypothetical protein
MQRGVYGVSVVVFDPDMLRTRVGPSKTDTVLIVDADAVLAFAISLQGLESIARRIPQVVEATRVVERVELSTCDGP